MIKNLCVALFLVLTIQTMSAFAIESVLVTDSIPQQINRYSCQSHFFALALSKKDPATFPISNSTDVSGLETRIRKEIKKAAGSGEVWHSHWKTAIEKITDKKYTVYEKSFKSLQDLIVYMTGKTALTDFSPGDKIKSYLLSDTILGVSVKRIHNSTYKHGHVISVLGVGMDGSLLASNSYIKGKEGKIIRAGIIRGNDYELKIFGDRYRIYEIIDL